MSKLEKEGRKEAVSYVSPNEEVGDGRNGSQRASVFPGFALTWKSALKVTAGFGSPSRVDSRRLQLKCILPQRIITGRFVILARWQAFENWGQSVGEQGRWEGIGWGQPQPPTDCGEGGGLRPDPGEALGTVTLLTAIPGWSIVSFSPNKESGTNTFKKKVFHLKHSCFLSKLRV